MGPKSEEVHERALARLRLVVERWTLAEAADAFLASLSTRRIDWRRALGARVVARHLPEHVYVKQQRYSSNDRCGVCGLVGYDEGSGDSPAVLAGYLEELGDARPRPTPADIAVLNGIFAAVAEQQRLSIDGRVRRADLAKALGAVVKGNKDERMELLDDLGRASMLATAAAPGFLRRFVPYDERAEGGGNNEFAYPFALWTAADGIDVEAARELFPHPGVVLDTKSAAPPVADGTAARAELERLSATARGSDRIAEVPFAPGGLWIARLDDGRYALFYKVKRRWRWVPGTREEVLACVPDALFDAAVAALGR